MISLSILIGDSSVEEDKKRGQHSTDNNALNQRNVQMCLFYMAFIMASSTESSMASSSLASLKGIVEGIAVSSYTRNYSQCILNHIVVVSIVSFLSVVIVFFLFIYILIVVHTDILWCPK